MICKNCKALSGKQYTKSENDYKGCSCDLGYETKIVDGIMMSIYRCEKPKSWKALERLMKKNEKVPTEAATSNVSTNQNIQVQTTPKGVGCQEVEL